MKASHFFILVALCILIEPRRAMDYFRRDATPNLTSKRLAQYNPMVNRIRMSKSSDADHVNICASHCNIRDNCHLFAVEEDVCFLAEYRICQAEGRVGSVLVPNLWGIFPLVAGLGAIGAAITAAGVTAAVVVGTLALLSAPITLPALPAIMALSIPPEIAAALAAAGLATVGAGVVATGTVGLGALVVAPLGLIPSLQRDRQKFTAFFEKASPIEIPPGIVFREACNLEVSGPSRVGFTRSYSTGKNYRRSLSSNVRECSLTCQRTKGCVAFEYGYSRKSALDRHRKFECKFFGGSPFSDSKIFKFVQRRIGQLNKCKAKKTFVLTRAVISEVCEEDRHRLNPTPEPTPPVTEVYTPPPSQPEQTLPIGNPNPPNNDTDECADLGFAPGCTLFPNPSIPPSPNQQRTFPDDTNWCALTSRDPGCSFPNDDDFCATYGQTPRCTSAWRRSC